MTPPVLDTKPYTPIPTAETETIILSSQERESEEQQEEEEKEEEEMRRKPTNRKVIFSYPQFGVLTIR